MNTCSVCGRLLDWDGTCEHGCKPIESTRPKKRPPEWPTHCEGCGVEFKKTNTYCYNYCPDC